MVAYVSGPGVDAIEPSPRLEYMVSLNMWDIPCIYSSRLAAYQPLLLPGLHAATHGAAPSRIGRR